MFKPLRSLLLMSLFFAPSLAIKAEDGQTSETSEKEFTLVVDQLENAIQGKSHRPLEEFVAENASFQGRRPLRQMLRDAKPVKFAPDSRRYWLKLSEVDRKSNVNQYVPEGVDAKESVLVFRDMDRRDDRKFRVFYWLSKIDGKWMVVHNADGWDSADPLASAAKKFSADIESQKGASKP